MTPFCPPLCPLSQAIVQRIKSTTQWSGFNDDDSRHSPLGGHQVNCNDSRGRQIPNILIRGAIWSSDMHAKSWHWWNLYTRLPVVGTNMNCCDHCTTFLFNRSPDIQIIRIPATFVKFYMAYFFFSYTSNRINFSNSCRAKRNYSLRNSPRSIRTG